MSKARRKPILPDERQSEILGVAVLGLTLFLFLALVTDGFPRLGLTERGIDGMLSVPNLMLVPGAFVAGIVAILVGDAGHVIYALTFIWGLMLFTHRPVDRLLTRMLGMIILVGAVAALLQVDFLRGAANPAQPGGAFGAFVADTLAVPNFGIIGANVIGFTMIAIGILLATDFLFIHLAIVGQRAAAHVLRGNLAFADGAIFLWRRMTERRLPAKVRAAGRASKDADAAPAIKNHDPDTEVATGREQTASAEKQLKLIRITNSGEAIEPEVPFDDFPDAEQVVETFDAPFEEAIPEPIEEAIEEPVSEVTINIPEMEEPAEEFAAIAEEEVSAKEADNNSSGGMPSSPRLVRKAKKAKDFIDELPEDYVYPKRYTLPPINMLDKPERNVITNLKEQLQETSKHLEDTLQEFNIDAKVTDVTRGPTITRFELEPAPGIKVSRFLALADDIALALKAHRVRIEAPIPGKSRVGIEVPNRDRDSVLIRELLESKTYRDGKGAIKLGLGKDITGDVIVADLATMPHLLVAGATGAGKTVCVKALLASLLFKHTPDELQLMLIDPKMVEFSTFNDIPHLITPVVTEAKKASVSLAWLINEMEERYRLFADLRVRNIEVYNESVDNGEIQVEGAEEDAEAQQMAVVRKLPYIVCVIDELADLMMLARAEVEDAIARLAQLARAVGIHMIIATQRPSVDVLTGVIKANFPARVSFQVSSRVDSRCILDEIGAERLIGNGDMLYLPAGQSKPNRIQGAFVSDDEMHSLVAYLKTQAPAQYRDEIERYGQKKGRADEILEEDDPLFDDAVRIVLETGQASISMVQRRLRVGYTRAARLVDMMELKGIVGPHTGSKAREILVNSGEQDDVA